MIEIKLIEDLSKLTTIPENSLLKLAEKSEWCICNSMTDLNLSDNNYICIDMYIGKLYISDENDEIRYKFIPSESLCENIKRTLTEGKNPLQETLEKRLIDKIINTYKDII